MAIVVVLLAWSLFPTQLWIDFFVHPFFETPPEVTVQGAILWRAMLAMTAVAIVAAVFIWDRLGSTGRLPTSGRRQTHDRGHDSDAVYSTDREKPDSPEAAGIASRPHLLVLLLTGAIGIGFVLRFLRINEGLWYDEISGWIQFGQYGPGPIIGNYFDPANHIFQTLLTWLSVTTLHGIVSIESAMRLPAMAAWIVGIFVMFELGKMAGGARCGLLAVLLSAVGPLWVLQSVEARGYMFMMVGAAWATLAFWRAIAVQWEGHDRSPAGRWIIYAAIGALACWAHPLTAMVMLGHGLIAVCLIFAPSRRSVGIAALLGVFLAGLATVMLYAPVIPGMWQIREMFLATEADQPLLFGVEGWMLVMQLGGAWVWWAALPGWLLAGYGMWIVATTCRGSQLSATVFAAADESRRRTMQDVAPQPGWLVTSMVIGLPVAAVLVLLAGTWVYARFLLFVVPGMTVLIAIGIDGLFKRHQFAGIGAVLIVASVATADLATRPAKQPLRDAADHIMQHIDPEREDVLVIGIAHRVMDFYLVGVPVRFSPFHGKHDLERHLEVPPAWAIVLYPRHVGEERLARLEAAGLTFDTRFRGWADWSNGDVLVYRRTK